MITVLLAFICTSAAMDNCTVWQEGKWIGPAAPVYCTAERDLAEASTPPGLFVRYECESISSEGLAHANDR
jgi:hypothetical protein